MKIFGVLLLSSTHRTFINFFLNFEQQGRLNDTNILQETKTHVIKNETLARSANTQILS